MQLKIDDPRYNEIAEAVKYAISKLSHPTFHIEVRLKVLKIMKSSAFSPKVKEHYKAYIGFIVLFFFSRIGYIMKFFAGESIR